MERHLKLCSAKNMFSYCVSVPSRRARLKVFINFFLLLLEELGLSSTFIIIIYFSATYVQVGASQLIIYLVCWRWRMAVVNFLFSCIVLSSLVFTHGHRCCAVAGNSQGRPLFIIFEFVHHDPSYQISFILSRPYQIIYRCWLTRRRYCYSASRPKSRKLQRAPAALS